MRSILLLLVISFIEVFSHKILHKVLNTRCVGIQINGVFHRYNVLADGLNRPYQLAFYKKEHEVYFSNNIGNDTEDSFEIKFLKKDNETRYIQGTINEIKNGFAVAIDEERGIAYFGGSDGIYKLPLDGGNLTQIVHNHNIWDLFFKDHLYFITFPSQKLYKYAEPIKKKKKEKENKTKRPMPVEWMEDQEIYQFLIDGEDDKFFTNETGLFMVKNETESPIHIEGETVFRGMAVNGKGEAHFAGQNGIYVLRKHNRTLHELAHVKNIFGITFDSIDQIVYSDPLRIVRLVPSHCNVINGVAKYTDLV